jgi:membrane protease YdiL (CAAX protease family)
MTSTARAPAVVGLLVAWGGTALLVSPLADRLGDPTSLRAALLAQALLWLLFAVVVVIVLLWEKQPLASLWLQPFQWQSLAWAAGLFVAGLVVVFPATESIRHTLGLPGYAAGMNMVMRYPVWFRVLASVTAGVVEETLFHGLAVTRLLKLTGSPLLAIVVSSAVFAGLHFPMCFLNAATTASHHRSSTRPTQLRKSTRTGFAGPGDW